MKSCLKFAIPFILVGVVAGCTEIQLIEEPDEIPMETICRR